MKKIKLLIALCVSLLCVGAVTANAATMKTTMADEVALFENLGFNLPETTAETDFVTRGQFVGTLTQYINTEFATGGEYTFQDVPKDDVLSGALNYAVAMGIVSDGDNFYPQNNVTYPQAMKMAVAFLGRSVEAESLGGYDGGGYNAIASTYKLYAGLQDMTGEFVTVRDFYKILYNVGNAKMMVRDQFGNLYTGKTPFEEYYNMYHIRGIVTANDRTTLTDDTVKMPDGVIALYEDMYRYEGDAPLGYSVEGWASYESGNIPRIVMFKEYKNNVTELSLVDLGARITSDTFYYEKDGREAKIKIDDPIILYNNMAAPTMRMSDIVNCKLGTIAFIDNDDDNQADVVSISEYRPVVVSVTSKLSMKIVDKNGGNPVLLDNNGKVKSYKIVKDGKEIKINELAADDLLAVYESRSKSYIYIEVATDVVSGKVTSHNSVARKIKIGDAVYNISDYFNSYYMSRVVVNNEIDLAITPDGVVHAITSLEAARNNYGVILKCWNDKSTEKLMIKLATGKDVITVKVSDKIKLDGQKTTESNLKKTISTLKEGGYFNLLVKYALNADGTEIKVIDTIDTTASADVLTGNENPDNNLVQWKFMGLSEDSSPWFTATNGGFAPYVINIDNYYLLTDDDSTKDEDVFVIKDRDLVTNKQATKSDGSDIMSLKYVKLFNVDIFGNAEAYVYVQKTLEDQVVGNSDPRGVVYSVSKAVNTDDEITYEVVIFRAGTYYTYFMSEDLYTKIVGGKNKLPSVGDYVGYKIDSFTDEICAIQVDYELASHTGKSFYSKSVQDLLTEDAAIIGGWIYDINGTSMAIIPEGGKINPTLDKTNYQNFKLGTDKLISVNAGSAAMNIVFGNGKVADASLGDLETFVGSPKNADYVIIRLKDGVLQDAVVYK